MSARLLDNAPTPLGMTRAMECTCICTGIDSKRREPALIIYGIGTYLMSTQASCSWPWRLKTCSAQPDFIFIFSCSRFCFQVFYIRYTSSITCTYDVCCYQRASLTFYLCVYVVCGKMLRGLLKNVSRVFSFGSGA